MKEKTKLYLKDLNGYEFTCEDVDEVLTMTGQFTIFWDGDIPRPQIYALQDGNDEELTDHVIDLFDLEDLEDQIEAVGNPMSWEQDRMAEDADRLYDEMREREVL